MFKKIMLTALVATTMCLAAQAQKFGYCNSSELLNAMPEATSMKTELQTISEKYDKELQNLQDAFQKKYSEYEAQANDASTPQAIKDRHEQELQEEYNKIQNFREKALQDLQTQQERLQAPIIQKVQNAIQAVGAEGGYTFIFDQVAGAIVYTGTNAEDVTSKIKSKLGI